MSLVGTMTLAAHLEIDAQLCRCVPQHRTVVPRHGVHDYRHALCALIVIDGSYRVGVDFGINRQQRRRSTPYRKVLPWYRERHGSHPYTELGETNSTSNRDCLLEGFRMVRAG
jgi:hypothetical protein